MVALRLSFLYCLRVVVNYYILNTSLGFYFVIFYKYASISQTLSGLSSNNTAFASLLAYLLLGILVYPYT
jgi:hypothetical protein